MPVFPRWFLQSTKPLRTGSKVPPPPSLRIPNLPIPTGKHQEYQDYLHRLYEHWKDTPQKYPPPEILQAACLQYFARRYPKQYRTFIGKQVALQPEGHIQANHMGKVKRPDKTLFLAPTIEGVGDLVAEAMSSGLAERGSRDHPDTTNLYYKSASPIGITAHGRLLSIVKSAIRDFPKREEDTLATAFPLSAGIGPNAKHFPEYLRIEGHPEGKSTQDPDSGPPATSPTKERARGGRIADPYRLKMLKTLQGVKVKPSKVRRPDLMNILKKLGVFG
jgi:hypothetical protein